MEPSYTKHGMSRALERTSLELQVIHRLIDAGIAVDIGLERGTERRHFLFYSPPDESFFIAIRDQKTKEIVTVLSEHFHNRICWNITGDQKAKARNSAINWEFKQPTENIEPTPLNIAYVPKSWPIVRVSLRMPDGERKRIEVGRWNVKDGFERLFSDPNFKACAKSQIGRNLREGGRIIGLSLGHIGTNFQPVKQEHVEQLRRLLTPKMGK